MLSARFRFKQTEELKRGMLADCRPQRRVDALYALRTLRREHYGLVSACVEHLFNSCIQTHLALELNDERQFATFLLPCLPLK